MSLYGIRVTELLLYVLLIRERAIYRCHKYIDNTLVTIKPPLQKCDHSHVGILHIGKAVRVTVTSKVDCDLI